jgi:hypothetical protein
MNHTAQRCLVIPDVHQDIAWVERILARETDWDRVVFLGDYFDSRLPPQLRANLSETCEFLDKTRADLGPRAVFLLGNHDIQYLEAVNGRGTCRAQRHLRYKCGAAYSHSAAKVISKKLSADFWAGARLAVSVNGWLLSHAGVAPVHWPKCSTPAESLSAFDATCRTVLKTLRTASHPLLQAGEVRGGDAPVGGVTWLDWDDEFTDELSFPQLVGHTANGEGARQKGRSWCLDGMQSTYGVLTGTHLRVKVC